MGPLHRLQHPGLTAAAQRSPRRMAVIIAVIYKGQDQPLKGSHKGALKMKKFLVDNGYDEKHIRMLLDDGDKTSVNSPTYDNIVKALEDLVRNAEPGDHYFVYYTGHGAQITNLDGTEKDGKDEVLLPLNSTTNYGTGYFDRDRYQNSIIDDKLNDILVKSLPVGAHLVAFFDCCHSGTMLDLPYTRYYNTILLDSNPEGREAIPGHGGASENNNDSPNSKNGGPHHYSSKSSREFVLPHVLEGNRRNLTIRGATDDSISIHPARADVVSWSASSDAQRTWIHEKYGGILTNTFIDNLRKNPKQTYQDLISHMTKDYRKYSEDIKNSYSRSKSNSVDNENDYKHEPQLAFNNPPNMNMLVTF